MRLLIAPLALSLALVVAGPAVAATVDAGALTADEQDGRVVLRQPGAAGQRSS